MPFFEDLGARTRAAWESLRRRCGGEGLRNGMKSGVSRLNRGSGRWRAAKWTVAALAAFCILYYPIGMAAMHRIDDDPSFAPPKIKDGQSLAVATTMALLDREVNVNGWRANDPFFLPSAALDNMPNFQLGMMSALSRFGTELADQLARTRGSSQIDPDVETAMGLLKYPGDVWIFNFSTSMLPTASSESQYMGAYRALGRYNERLAAATAVFERRADNLISTLDRISSDLGSSSAQLDRRIQQGGGLIFDRTSDDVFYRVKGRLYGTYMILKALGVDFAIVIRDKELGGAWEQMLESFRTAATLDPLMVANCDPDAQLCPSHLAAQGFYLLRARTQLQEVSNILLK